MSVKLLKAGKHSCVGHLSAGGTASSENARLEKPAMLVYCGTFDSMDGEVEITEGHIDKIIENHNFRLDKLKKLATSADLVEKSAPPLQVDHSTSAHDTIGRVIGILSKGQYVMEDGKSVPSLMIDRVLVLGEENVDKVLDGRWANLSIGADLDKCTLNEVSVTPFPAAAHASLLKNGKTSDLTGHVDESLWERASNESKKLFGDVKNHFTSWRYQRGGGKFHKASASLRQPIDDTFQEYFEAGSYRGHEIYCIITKPPSGDSLWQPYVEGSDKDLSTAFPQYMNKEAAIFAARRAIDMFLKSVKNLKNPGEVKEVKYKNATLFVMTQSEHGFQVYVSSEYIPTEPCFHGADESTAIDLAKRAVDEYLKNNAWDSFPTSNPKQQAKKLSKGEDMKEKLKKHLMEKYKMSEEQADDHMSKMKGHLAKKLAADDAKAEEHMASMSDEDAHKLADDVKTEEDKKLADDVKEEDKKLTARREKIVSLAKGVRTGLKSSKLAAREQLVMAKIARLRSSAKMTPAEQKKINVTELSGKPDAELAAFFKGYEIRENVIDPRVHGTTRALSLSSLDRLSKDKRTVRLESEARHDMGMPMDEKHKKEMSEGTQHQVPSAEALSDGSQGQVPHEEMLKHLEGMLAEHPAKDAVMAHVKKMMDMKHMGEMPAEHAENVEKQMSALAENINRLQTEFQDLIGLVGESDGIKSADLAE